MNWLKNKFNTFCSFFSSYESGVCHETQSTSKEENFSTLKVTELRAIAKERGLKKYASLRKTELIDLLKQN